MGGDLEIHIGLCPGMPPEWLRARGAACSDVVQMRSMLVRPDPASAEGD